MFQEVEGSEEVFEDKVIPIEFEEARRSDREGLKAVISGEGLKFELCYGEGSVILQKGDLVL